MIENFTLDTDANPQNMNMLIAGINKNEEDISGLKTSVEGVSSQIGQIANVKTIDLSTINLLSYIDMESGHEQTHHFRVIPGTTANGAPELSWGVGYYAIQSAFDAFCIYFGQISNFINRKVAGSWIGWKEIATSEIYTLIPLVGVSTAYDETPTLIKTGKVCAIYGTVNLNAIAATSAIFQKLPPQFIPKRGAEIFIKNLFPPTLLPETRLYVDVGGIISIHGFQGTITSTSASFNGIWEV